MTDTLHDTTAAASASPEIPDGCEADADAIIREIDRPERWTGETVETPTGETIERTEPTEWRWLPKMDLPGFGSERETCGDEMYRFCSCCGESVEVGQTCYQPRCPRCAQEWCRRAATNAAAKLKALWAYEYSALDSHPYFHHLTISPPDDWILDHDPETVYKRTKEVVKRVMDELGIGGIPIYHPYRGSEEQPGDDMGEWSKRVFNDRDWEGDVAEEVEFSPHFHVVGVSPHVDVSVTAAVEEATGWVIHRITQGDSGVSVGNDFDLARVVSYCLSHAGVYQDGNGDSQAAYYPNVIHRSRDVTIKEQTRDEMDEIVRSVAPQTLGIDYSSVACYREVPKGEGGNMTVTLAGASADDDPDDGETSEESDEQDAPDPGDGPEMEKCEGKLLSFKKAPEYLQDDDWRANAPLAHRLEERYREWRRSRGLV
jgi:hypothetical protein